MDQLTKIFEYSGRQFRTVVIDNEPWFVAKDVCELLEISKYCDAVSRLSDRQRAPVKVDTFGGMQEMAAVNEAGLYKLIMRSNKPEADKFQVWICEEVLPSIRRSGMYAIERLSKLQILEMALESEKQRLTLQSKVAELEPKAEFFDAVADSKTAIAMAYAAKVLDIKGVGRNNLFRLLREKKILDGRNVPYQEYVDRGYFRVIEQKYTTPDGETHISIKTLVYQRGLDFIRKQLTKHTILAIPIKTG